jgi:hypothetical protein
MDLSASKHDRRSLTNSLERLFQGRSDRIRVAWNGRNRFDQGRYVESIILFGHVRMLSGLQFVPSTSRFASAPPQPSWLSIAQFFRLTLGFGLKVRSESRRQRPLCQSLHSRSGFSDQLGCKTEASIGCGVRPSLWQSA